MNPACKICGAATREAFRLPVTKKTGQPIPNLPDDCPYFECTACKFCFSVHLDNADHTQIYDETYWNDHDPDWSGRVTQSLRLVLLANHLVQREPYKLEVLDFGSGMGTFVQGARRDLGLQVWGTDIIPPRYGKDWYLRDVDRQFDIITAREVVEHIPTPVATFRQIRSMLKPGGAFAFQTAYYDPKACGRDWWYVGPDNGHISLYSREGLDRLYNDLGGSRRVMWNDYPGVQAWQFA